MLHVIQVAEAVAVVVAVAVAEAEAAKYSCKTSCCRESP